MTASVDVRRAGDRGTSTTDWLESRHSFSFADHYDPANTHHGLLMVYTTMGRACCRFRHPRHRDMEIVTWVLDGELEHRDSIGTSASSIPGWRSG